MLHRRIVAVIAALAARDATAQCSIAHQRVQVGILSTAYIANALVGARTAIRDSLPQSPFGIRTGRTPSADFYAGTGTALSPGLPILAAQATTTLALTRSASTARTGARVLGVFGVGYSVGQLAEPLARAAIAHPAAKPTRTAIVVGNVALPAAMAVLAFRNCR
jgi:hypothetical protein